MKYARPVLLCTLLVTTVALGVAPAQGRQRAHPVASGRDAARDLSALANAEENYEADTNLYGSVADLRAHHEVLEAFKGMVMRVKYYSPAHYCLSATFTNRSGRQEVWVLQGTVPDSLGVTVAPDPAPETTTSCTKVPVGLDGGSYTGKGSNSALEPLKTDLRNLAVNEETLLTDTNTYGTIAQMRRNQQTVKPSPGVTIRVVRYDRSNSYCLSASSSDGTGTHTVFYDSLANGTQPEGQSCPKATKGKAGDSAKG